MKKAGLTRGGLGRSDCTCMIESEVCAYKFDVKSKTNTITVNNKLINGRSSTEFLGSIKVDKVLQHIDCP